MFVIHLNYFFDRECLWALPNICLEKNVWKPSLEFGGECLKMPSEICLEKNPYNASLEYLWMHSNICFKKCSEYISIIWMIENVCDPCLIFVWKRMFGNAYLHLLGKKWLKTMKNSICNVYLLFVWERMFMNLLWYLFLEECLKTLTGIFMEKFVKNVCSMTQAFF